MPWADFQHPVYTRFCSEKFKLELTSLTFNSLIYFWIEIKAKCSYFSIYVAIENIPFPVCPLQSQSGAMAMQLNLRLSPFVVFPQRQQDFQLDRSSGGMTGFFSSVFKIPVSHLTWFLKFIRLGKCRFIPIYFYQIFYLASLITRFYS